MPKTWTSGISSLQYNLCLCCGKIIPGELKFCYECEFGDSVLPITQSLPTPSEINKSIDILGDREIYKKQKMDRSWIVGGKGNE